MMNKIEQILNKNGLSLIYGNNSREIKPLKRRNGNIIKVTILAENDNNNIKLFEINLTCETIKEL